MRLQDPGLTIQGRQDAASFAQELLDIGDATTTVYPSGAKTGQAPWKHGFLSDNSQASLITTLYSSLGTITLDIRYLAKKAILAIANVDVIQINNVCTAHLGGKSKLYLSYNKPCNPQLEEKFPSEYFQNFDDASLPPSSSLSQNWYAGNIST